MYKSDKTKLVLGAICLSLSLIDVAGQLYLPFANQANNGVRETIFAINAYCDNTCTPYQTQNMIGQCLEMALYQNDVIIQVLRACTVNTGYTINCNPLSLVQLENCVVPMAANRLGVESPFIKRCFRSSLSVGTIDCLRMRYPRLNRYLPLGPPTGTATTIANPM